MATKLDRPIKRELELEGEPYTVTISPRGVRIARKGRRNGHEISWEALVRGDAELREQLNISLDATAPDLPE